MDKFEILALMVSAKTPVAADWESVVMLYADRLARVAPKLTDDELYPLLAIGATIYQRWCQNADAEKVTAEALLRLRRPSG